MPALSLQGCVETIAAWLRKNVLLVAGAALGIAFVEVRNAVGWGRAPGSAQGIWGTGGTHWPGNSGCWVGLGKLALSSSHPHFHPSFQVLGIIFSCCLVKSIRSGYEVM